METMRPHNEKKPKAKYGNTKTDNEEIGANDLSLEDESPDDSYLTINKINTVKPRKETINSISYTNNKHYCC